MGVDYMFIGREREVASLRQLYSSDKFEFVVLYHDLSGKAEISRQRGKQNPLHISGHCLRGMPLEL